MLPSYIIVNLAAVGVIIKVWLMLPPYDEAWYFAPMDHTGHCGSSISVHQEWELFTGDVAFRKSRELVLFSLIHSKPSTYLYIVVLCTSKMLFSDAISDKD